MSREPVHAEEYKGYDIKVYVNQYPTNPREYNNLGVMVCLHSRYTLGDKYQGLGSRYETIEDLVADIERLEDDSIIWLPLYLYDHSGLTMNTTGFSCPWDSSCVGVIFTTRVRVLREYKRVRISAAVRNKAISVLEQEVRMYNKYLTGDFYEYITRKEDVVIGSCGEIASVEEAIRQAKETIYYG
jgi:hypothetical protein